MRPEIRGRRFATTVLSVTSSALRLPPNTDQFTELLDWIEAANPGRISVLDVGGGGGFYEFPSSLRGRSTRMVGVDPDAGVLTRPWLDEGHQMLMEEYAPSSSERFDVALCVYVVEHVENPVPFFQAIRTVVRPGGSCFGITPNLLHYFGVVSATATRLGIEDWLLHKVRSPDLIEAYHSPVRYRCNTTHRIRSTATTAGFRESEFRVLEQPGMFETYFPPALQWWPRAYSRMVNRWAPPELFGTVLFRLTA